MMKTAGEAKYGYCGPGRLAFVAQKFGLQTTPDSLAGMMGTTAEKGTLPEKMAAAARQLGLEASAGENNDIGQLKSARQDGAEVIVDWLLDGKKDGGHYSIFAGVEAGQVILVDPLAGNEGEDVFWRLTEKDFEEKWHDFRPDDGTRVERWAMVILGRLA